MLTTVLLVALSQQSRPIPPGLTAFRPQDGAGYFPFARTRVPEALEEHPELGPGIRVNGAGELDPSGEDDLIELVVARPLADTTLVLERGGPELHVWGTRTRLAGTELAFTANQTAPLPLPVAGTLTLWVEWSGAPGLRALALRALEPDVVHDRLLFHAFTSRVIALGGEGQVPGVPVDPNHGTFLVATDLYEQGYDVLMRDEDQVDASGNGPVYTEVVNAIQHRGVTTLAIFGYSHGGGSTHDLSERLDAFRGSIGTFTIAFTSYVDGVENDSDTDLDRELRKPPSSGYHANHYQVGSLADFFLDGGPVTASFPAPTGLNVETIFWGVGATHFLVDDFDEVRGFMQLNLEPRVPR
jgi:hypothetical protein